VHTIGVIEVMPVNLEVHITVPQSLCVEYFLFVCINFSKFT